jgi:hypothetical protein
MPEISYSFVWISILRGLLKNLNWSCNNPTQILIFVATCGWCQWNNIKHKFIYFAHHSYITEEAFSYCLIITLLGPHDFILPWSAILIPLFWPFVSGLTSLDQTAWRVSLFYQLSCCCAGHTWLVKVTLVLSKVNCFQQLMNCVISGNVWVL